MLLGNQIFISLAKNKITKPKKLTTLILFLKKEELQGFKDILNKLSIEIEVHDFIKYLKGYTSTKALSLILREI